MSYETDETLTAFENIASQLDAAEVVDEKDDSEDVSTDSVDEVDVKTDGLDLDEKAQSIMSMMKKPKGGEESIFLTDIRFKEMEEAGELISDDDYDALSEEEKTMYQRVNVMNDDTKSGMGMRWRLREMMNDGEKGMDSEKKPKPMFLTDIRYKEMMESGELMDDEAYGKLSDDEKGSCSRVDVYNEKTKKGMGMHWRRRMPMEREQEVKKNEKSLEAADAESFRCGIQQKSVQDVCDFCRGGCKSEDGLPGLEEVELLVKSAFADAEIIDSGYSSAEDMFLVDIKRAEGDYIEVAYSGSGQQLGWFVIDPDLVEKREQADIISAKDAQAAAVATVDGSVTGVFPDVFQDTDVYSVQIETDEKSYDVYVSLDGTVVGYDEYEFEQQMTEEDEIKALEAELNIKRMYSREQRTQMAESGDALPDGSFPIADKADLQNAIQAYGRAGDKAAAKTHIMKRAKELGLEDMLPEEWMNEEGQEGDAKKPAAATDADMDAEGEKDAQDLIESLNEFTELLAALDDIV